MERPTIFDSYDEKRELPLGGYSSLIGIFGLFISGGLGAALWSTRRESHGEDGPRPGDVLLLGVATYQLSRIVAKDRVLSPFRAPFTRYVEPAGAGELRDTARGTGLQKAVGDLLTCPYCLAPWVATGLSIAAVLRPRQTRWLASVFAVVAIADTLQQGYAALKKLTP